MNKVLSKLQDFSDSVVAIIPARIGSKRIPKKNLQLIKNQSLIKRALSTAFRSEIFDHIILSCDSNEIAEQGKGIASEIHMRKKINAIDTASTESLIEEVIEFYPNIFNDKTLIYLLQCTSPFLEPIDLKKSYEEIKNQNYEYESIFSGYLFSKFIWQLNGCEQSYKAINYNPINRPRSQDSEKFYVENGAFYIFGKSNFDNTKCRLHGKIGLHEMKEIKSVDIDEPFDLKFSNHIYDLLYK